MPSTLSWKTITHTMGRSSNKVRPIVCFLDAEISDAVEQGDAQLLVQVLIKNTLMDGFSDQQRTVPRQNLLLRILISRVRQKQQLFEIHFSSPPSFFRSF